MEIGRPQRIIEIEPVSLPVPSLEPMPISEPMPMPEPMHEPAPAPSEPADT
jgi:hypothetical protein